jgi:hypothetical protein
MDDSGLCTLYCDQSLPTTLAARAVAGRTAGQPGPWEPLPDDVYEALPPRARRRFAHAHHWDEDRAAPYAPFPYGAHHPEHHRTDGAAGSRRR